MNKIAQNLSEMAHEAVGPVDLWPGIERRAPRRSRRARWMPASRLGWAAVVALLAVLLTTAAYAASPLFVDVYLINPSWNPDAASLGHSVDSSQTIDGVTVTVEQIYLDQERILIETSVTGPQGMSLAHSGAELYDGQGLLFPWIDGAGHVELGKVTWVLAFDATPLADPLAEREFELLLNVNGIEVVEEARVSPNSTEGESGAGAVELEPLSTSNYGPFRLELRIPGTVTDAP